MTAIGNETGTAGGILAWKTITLGRYRSVDALRAALERERIWVGDLARALMDLSTFTLRHTESDVDLALLSVAELGFHADGAALAVVHARAMERGLALCPAEVGPLLRLAYRDQPVGEYLQIAMAPMVTAKVEAASFIIGRRAGPDAMLAPTVRLVLVLPR